MADAPRKRAPAKPAKKAPAKKAPAKKAPAKKAPAKKAPAKAPSAADIVASVAAETPGELNAVDPAFQAHQVRLTGASWSEVAEKAGYDTPQNAMLAVNTYLQRAAMEQAFEHGQLALQLELDRLDQLQASWWKLANLGDKDALKGVLDIMKMRGTYLKLAAAEKVTERQTIIITSTDDMAEQLRRMAMGEGSGELPPTAGPPLTAV